MRQVVVVALMALVIGLASVKIGQSNNITIDITTNKSTYTPGEDVIVTVIVKKDGEPYANCLVGFEVKDPRGGGFPLPPEYTDASGKVVKSFKLSPSVPLGEWTIIATISGIEYSYRGSCTFVVTKPQPPPTKVKKSSSIQVDLSSYEIVYGECVVISGSIIVNEIISTNVRIEYSLDNLTWTPIATTRVVNNSYNYSWCPPKVGTYFLRVRWFGSDEYYGATSRVVKLTVLKANVSVLLTVSKRELRVGEELTLECSLMPPLPDIPVIIEYSVNNGPWIMLSTVKTNSEGRFSITWAPPLGNVVIKVSWSGNENYNGFVKVISVSVKKLRRTLTLAKDVNFEYSSKLSVRGEFNRELGLIELTVGVPVGYSDVVVLRVPKKVLREYDVEIGEVVVLVDDEIVSFAYKLENDTYVLMFGVESGERRVRVLLTRKSLTVTFSDQLDRPIIGALVELYYNHKTLLARGFTNDSGILSLKLPVGNYTVRISWRGVVREEKVKVEKTGIRIDEKLGVFDLTVKVFTSMFKAPIPAVVVLEGAEFSIEATTNATGTCVFTQLPPGDYKVKVMSLGAVMSKSISLDKNVVITFSIYYVGELVLIVGVIVLLVAIVLNLVAVVRLKRR